MKKLIFSLTLITGIVFATQAQKAKVIKLEQVPGAFKTTELTLKEGKPYVFEVSNNGVDHAVGFAVAPSGKTDHGNHIKAAYVSKIIQDGETSQSKEVVLEAGEYVFFCPLNPTPKYKIVVNK